MKTLSINISSTTSAKTIVPGLVLCIGVVAVAYGFEFLERVVFGNVWIESLVLAIAIGAVVATIKPPSESFAPGIRFSAKILLEVAIVLLGASVSVAAVAGAGVGLLVCIVLGVFASIAVAYFIGRLFGLPPRLSILIACGNSICGNSAIVAVAPVIKATSTEVAASLAFTAVLGVAAVFILPIFFFHGGLSQEQYGVLAGMTVYAVPQVLAATAPVGVLAVHVGTIVKLVRVLMLGPVIFIVGRFSNNAGQADPGEKNHTSFVPWFIVGFLLMMALRSLDVLPAELVAVTSTAATLLTVVSMAALGLSVDIRKVSHAGGKVIATATISLLTLGAISMIIIKTMHIA